MLAVAAVGCTSSAPHHTTPAPAAGPVPGVSIAAAGDIACSPKDPHFHALAGTPRHCQQRATSDLILALQPTAVLAVGDTQYQRATLADFLRSYEPTWGRFKSITYPVAGNHEYESDASGYYAYFGAHSGPKGLGYYSVDLSGWHLVALNADCAAIGGCQHGSPEEAWLRADVAAHPGACTLAFWHEPRFSSGLHGDNATYAAWWHDLYAAHADVVVNGHDHDYERFAPQDPDGKADPRGIREFVVGTGGNSLRAMRARQPNSQVFTDQDFGVLQLTLHPDGYTWRFVSVHGRRVMDSGQGSCH